MASHILAPSSPVAATTTKHTVQRPPPGNLTLGIGTGALAVL